MNHHQKHTLRVYSAHIKDSVHVAWPAAFPLMYGGVHTHWPDYAELVSRAQGHTGAGSVLADGLDLLLGETDYHHPPIYPHKHRSCMEHHQDTMSIRHMYLNCSIRGPRAEPTAAQVERVSVQVKSYRTWWTGLSPSAVYLHCAAFIWRWINCRSFFFITLSPREAKHGEPEHSRQAFQRPGELVGVARFSRRRIHGALR